MSLREENPAADQAGPWLASLPVELDVQRRLLTRLVGFCDATALVTSLSVGCSLGRGVADALSDVDAALGVDAARGAPGTTRVMAVEHALVAAWPADSVVGLLRERIGAPDRLVRRVLVQLRDGAQLDLALMAETEVRRGAAAPDFVSLYRAPGRGEGPDSPSSPEIARFPPAGEVTAEQVHAWAFHGWWALGDAVKHLQRSSPWEAHQSLHEARDRIWALWAAAHGAPYPWHGLSQVLDQDPHGVPPGIEGTVAGLDRTDLRRAVRGAAQVLQEVSDAAARRYGADLPTDLGDHVVDRLHGSS